MKKFFLLILNLSFVGCFDSKKSDNSLLMYFLFNQKSGDKTFDFVEVDFSTVGEKFYDVLAYKEKSQDSFLSFTSFSLSQKAKDLGWKELPTNKKVEIQKGFKIELSLGGVVSLGEKKITSKQKLTLSSVMGDEKKVKNFVYLALSLGSEKNGKLVIQPEDLNKLEDKSVDFSKDSVAFKKDSVVQKALVGKTPVSDKKVEAAMKEIKPTKPTDPKPTLTLSNPEIGDEKLQIKWTVVTGVNKYKVYYGKTANCDKTKKDSCMSKEGTGTNLILDSLTNGSEYKFFVVGLNDSGKEITELSVEKVSQPKTKVGFFVTSEGSVSTRNTGTRVGFSGGNLGGIAGADAQCRTLAESAGLGSRTWKAFLYTTTEKPHDRIGTGPWYNIDKAKIGDDPDALENQESSLAFLALLKDEKGNAIRSAEHDILIGGNKKNGTATANNTCNNWTDDSTTYGGGYVGHAGPNDRSDANQWLYAHTVRCHPMNITGSAGAGKFYCFASDENPNDF